MKATYEELERKIAVLDLQLNLSLVVERAWETTMMLLACGEDGPKSVADKFAKLQAKCAELAAENAALKSSRAVLSENALEACNAIASAGFRHEAIMRGLYASTGNGNKYPRPITTLVDEALCEVKTPETDAYLAEVRAQGVDAAIERLIQKFEGTGHIGVPVMVLESFAAQLRQDANTAELVVAGIITKVGE